MDDLISRQAAVDELIALGDWYKDKLFRRVVLQCIRAIYDVPSAQPDGRYINANELIKRLKEAGHEEAAAMALKMAGHERKKNLPSAESKQRWIPCSEAVPMIETDVLLTAWDGKRKFVGWIDAFGKWFADEEEVKKGYEPLAWMPLPEPWRGEEHETD